MSLYTSGSEPKGTTQITVTGGPDDVGWREGFMKNSIIMEKNKNLYLTKLKQNCVLI
jgi:hypothetical protein